MSGSKGPKVSPTRHHLVILSMQTLPGKSPVKAMSESSIVLCIASITRLRPFKASSPWPSPALKDGCTNVTWESFISLKVSLSAWKRSGKILKEK